LEVEMAAMLVAPAAGLVQVQQDGRLAPRRAPVVSTNVSMSSVLATGVIRTSSNSVRVDSERRDRTLCRIASPKLRFVA